MVEVKTANPHQVFESTISVKELVAKLGYNK